MDKPIISLWGFGPSYRKRIKLNILEAINSGYDNIMDYVILTDYPEDFIELAEQTGKIKAIIDINEARKDYPWSEKLEHIPSAPTDEKEYAKQYVDNLNNNKYFSYSLHRFSFPTLAKLGYNKIVFMDSDVKIKYEKIINGTISEEDFWAEFDTPVNTMKGVVAEKVYINNENNTFKWSRAMGMGQSLYSLQLSSIIINKLNEKYNTIKFPLITELNTTEGPFRYYHLESSKKVQELFNIWNECMNMILSNNFLNQCQLCGGYMLCDYMPVGIANLYCDISVLNFPNIIYNIHIHYEDRYFLPISSAPGLGTLFIPSDTQEGFMKNNEELKKVLEERNAWPHQEPNYQ
jgi:hypothetical protein